MLAWILSFAISIAPAHAPSRDQAVIREFAPIFFFHPDEKYGPMDPGEFLKKVRVSGVGKIQNLENFDYSGLPADSDLVAPFPITQPVSSESAALFWQHGSSPLLGELPRNHAWSLIEYWIHLPFNETGLWLGLGDHQGDWEGVALLFRDSEVAALYTSRHEGGAWLCPDEIEWTEGAPGRGRPVFYSALGTHATYAKAGRFARNFLGIGDDLTAKGVAYDGSRALRHLASQNFAGFRGHWGRAGLLPWNRGPRLPRAGEKFLPRDRHQKDLKRMARDLARRCGAFLSVPSGPADR